MELVIGKEYMVEKLGKVGKAVYVCYGGSSDGDVMSHMFMYKRKIKGIDGKSYKYAFVAAEDIDHRVKEVK